MGIRVQHIIFFFKIQNFKFGSACKIKFQTQFVKWYFLIGGCLAARKCKKCKITFTVKSQKINFIRGEILLQKSCSKWSKLVSKFFYFDKFSKIWLLEPINHHFYLFFQKRQKMRVFWLYRPLFWEFVKIKKLEQ